MTILQWILILSLPWFLIPIVIAAIWDVAKGNDQKPNFGPGSKNYQG